MSDPPEGDMYIYSGASRNIQATEGWLKTSKNTARKKGTHLFCVCYREQNVAQGNI